MRSPALLEKIVSLCAEPVSFENLLKALFDAYGMEMNAQQYALIGSTVRSCLSVLHGQGRLVFLFRENRMLWTAAE